MLNIRAIPSRTLATLVLGLRPNSRVYRAISGEAIDLKEQLLAMMVDNLAWIAWSKTEAARKGRGKPKSVLEVLLNAENSDNTVGFSNPEEFEEARNKIIRGE